MTEIKPPDMEAVNDLKAQMAALQAGGGTPEDLARMQIALQKWSMANERQAQVLREMSETLKGMIQKVG